MISFWLRRLMIIRNDHSVIFLKSPCLTTCCTRHNTILICCTMHITIHTCCTSSILIKCLEAMYCNKWRHAKIIWYSLNNLALNFGVQEKSVIITVLSYTCAITIMPKILDRKCFNLRQIRQQMEKKVDLLFYLSYFLLISSVCIYLFTYCAGAYRNVPLNK